MNANDNRAALPEPRHGMTLTEWEAAMREHVQSQLSMALLRLSHAAPGLIDTVGSVEAVDLPLPMPAGEVLRFTATLGRVV